MTSICPTSQLARTLEVRRAIHTQAIAVFLVVVLAAAWRVSPLHEPEPLTLVLLAVASAAFVLELSLGWYEEVRAERFADELILTGFADLHLDTRIGRTVSARVTRLQSHRARRRLAEDLRWRVSLANGWTRPSAGYLRAAAFPPLDPAQREIVRADTVLDIAARIERTAAVDPRALIALHRFIQPPTVPASSLAAQGRASALREELEVVCSLITPQLESRGRQSSCGEESGRFDQGAAEVGPLVAETPDRAS